jgi:MFS transporter, ACS family, glucarate transporter
VGGATAPLLAAYLIRLVGWRWTFAVFASVGVIWVIVFQRMFRDNPADHPLVNEAELRVIEAGSATEPASESHTAIPWRLVLTSPNVWLLGGLMTCLASVTYFVYSWFPKYLQAGRGVAETESGLLASLVMAGGAVGTTAGGFFCDALVRRTGERPWTLRLVGVIALLIASGTVWSSAAFDSAYLASALIGLTVLMIGIQITAWWASVTAISGKHLGALFGLMNSMGVVGAVSSQILVGRYVDLRKSLDYEPRAQWDPAFNVFALVLLIGAAAWLFIDSGRSAVTVSDQGPPRTT